jgi:dolichol kinase
MSEKRRSEDGNAPEESSLTDLVKKTEGLQPWRRLFHATNGTVLVLALRFLPVPTSLALLLLGTLLAVLILADALRLARPTLNLLFFQTFLRLASPREEKGIASSTWYVLGALLALILYPRSAALAGILTLALADPAASLAGRKWGRRKLGAGSLEGSLVFFLVASVVLSLFVPWPVAVASALGTSVVEALPWPVDDNLSVPLAAGGFLTLLG